MIKSFTLNSKSKILHTVAIMSSKGGVGKSTMTSLIATHLREKGYRIGILDADIIGPTISRVFGLTSKIQGQDGWILPATSATGIQIISSQLLLEKMDDPIVWRSPLVLDLIRQFYGDVIWGELDYLLIDLPPGTGDVSMTVLEQIPVDGIVMVTTPQETVQSIVGKGVQMAALVKKKILGVIENYSYFLCGHCQHKHDLFQNQNTVPLWQTYALPLLAKLPLRQDLPNLIDHGKIETITMPELTPVISILEAL
jgi:ATP-binding protein involved in chromosome partitioning